MKLPAVLCVLAVGCSSNGSTPMMDSAVPDSQPPDHQVLVESGSGRRDLVPWTDGPRTDGPRPDAQPPDTKPPYDLACAKTSEIEAENGTDVHQTGWNVASGSVLHNGQGLEAWSAGAVLDFSFAGTDLTVYHETGPNRGSFSVSVDGAAGVVVNTTTSTFQYQIPAVVATGLSAGTHTVSITCTTSICSVDYFVGHTCS